MTANEKYEIWKEKAVIDADLIAELEEISGNDEEISERFYKDLEFGTGGLRGVIGVGTNRMNVYTVGRATQGLCKYIKSISASGSVAIAYDSRIKSTFFAKRAAGIFASNGIKVHLYSELMPTPMLSYAVRYFGCDAGIVITASHNPAKYNGYKVYGSDGCQITNEVADIVLNYIENTDCFDDVSFSDFEDEVKSGNILYIGEDAVTSYLRQVKNQRVNPVLDLSKVNIIYTPLHGTGLKPVCRILDEIGAGNITVVPEQEKPDGNFPTTPFPNPEFRQAFECALKLAEKVKPDLLLANDPDCDRVGIAVLHEGEYKLVTGNDLGVLLLNYICEMRTKNGTMPKAPVAIKTIVTTEFFAKVCEEYRVELRNVLTGFKYIGEQIGELEKIGRVDDYIFGYEESYGYLAGSYVRDKDGVVASMLITEMTAYYKSIGKTLLDVLQSLYEKYGYYICSQNSFYFEGKDGSDKISAMMETMRNNPPEALCGTEVVKTVDYLSPDTGLPRSNVLAFHLKDGSSLLMRPSGTEPKIKLYTNAVGGSMSEAEEKISQMEKESQALIGL